MEFDVWRQWQSLSGLAPPPTSPFSPFEQPGAGPFVEAGARFAAAARAFADASRDASAPASAATAAQQFGNFLRDQFTESFKPPWIGKPGVGFAPSFSADAPALGLTREHQERAQRAADAARRAADAQQRLTRLWSDTLREAATAFARDLTAPTAGPQSAEELNRLYDAWIDCAEEAYARTAHSDAFCEALADYVNASSSWRNESSAMIEHWAKLLDLPTRSEVNTLALRLREVEEEMRSLRGAARPPARARGTAAAHRAARKSKS